MLKGSGWGSINGVLIRPSSPRWIRAYFCRVCAVLNRLTPKYQVEFHVRPVNYLSYLAVAWV